MPVRFPSRLLALFAFAVALVAGVSRAANAPTNLRLAAPFSTDNSMEFAWTDNSNDEDGFEWELRLNPADVDPLLVATARKNQTIVSTITGGGFGQTVYIRVRAKSTASGDSTWTPNVAVTLPTTEIAISNSARDSGNNLFTGNFHGGTVGLPITPYTPVMLGTATATGFSIEDLPPGLAFNTATGEISGTPTQDGFFRPRLTATDGVSSPTNFITFRIILNPAAPSVTTPLPDQTIAANAAPVAMDLDAYFSDPDTTEAARITTNRGAIDVILYDKTTPATIENFWDYATPGTYTDVVFHRASQLASSGVEVIQAGWFKPDGSGNYTSFTLGSQVVNEPGISNLRGTVAMAKLGGDANSGTSQWYFNVSDSTVLDPLVLNGGFTVFGRASTPTLPVVDDIYSLPIGSYTVTLDGGGRTITDWPTNQVPAGATPALADLVQILSVTPIADLLTYAVESNSDPAVATASIAGGNLEIAPASLTSQGETTVTVKATDLDGNVAMTSFLVTVIQNYDSWAQSRSFPGNLSGPLDDGEVDTLNNTLEYALEGNIALADPGTVSPDLSVPDVPGGSDHLAITFTHLKFAGDLSYEVQRNTDTGSWTTVWRTADGFAHPYVFEKIDGPSSYRLTVIDPDPVATFTASVLRVVVTLVPPSS